MASSVSGQSYCAIRNGRGRISRHSCWTGSTCSVAYTEHRVGMVLSRSAGASTHVVEIYENQFSIRWHAVQGDCKNVATSLIGQTRQKREPFKKSSQPKDG